MTTIPNAHPVDAAAADDFGDHFVLTCRPLKPGCTLTDTARFGDVRWNLGPAMFQEQMKSLTLNFEPIPVTYRLTVKLLCYAMLSGELPINESRPGVPSIRRHLVELKRFTVWLDQQGSPHRPLRALTGVDLAAYAGHLSVVLRSPATREVAEVAVRLLWRYRSVLPHDHLILDPLDADGWGNSTRRRRGENTTDRIPEQIMGPLLMWCLRFVDDFAPDIVAARSLWRATRNDSGDSPLRPGELPARLNAVLDTYQVSGRPLPGRSRGSVNIAAVAREVGCSPGALNKGPARAQIEAAAAANGVTASPVLDLPVNGRLDGQPWLSSIGMGFDDPTGVVPLSILLQAACYIVIAYLSGMRDSEIKHLRRGCVRTHRDSAGTPYRRTVTSLAFKGEADPTGVGATWVIGAPAARAVTVLEQLQPPHVDTLFRPLGNNVLDTAQAGAQDVARTNHLLNELMTWINNYCLSRGRRDGIPPMPGGRMQTRQFRRTLAWHIARRPGGAIAGAIQYRHLSIQMFEGYAGTSDSGFRAEVEAEQALARGEHLLTMTTGHDHHAVTGPAAAEAHRRLTNFADQTRFTGTVITDNPRLKRLMQTRDPDIYPGTYNTCVFDPSKAMCQPRPDSHGTIRPIHASCQPLDCSNTALTTDNRAALRAEVDRIDDELAQRPPLPPLLAHRLTVRRGKITAYLARHEAESTG